MLLNLLYIPAVLNVTSQQTLLWNLDPPPVHCRLLVLKMFPQSTHCSLLTVSLHDTLTSHCSCVNKSVFPNEQRSQLALGTSLVQQQLMHAANTAIHGLLYPGNLQANSQQLLTPGLSFRHTEQKDAFHHVCFHLRISLDLLSC